MVRLMLNYHSRTVESKTKLNFSFSQGIRSYLQESMGHLSHYEALPNRPFLCDCY